MITQKYCKWRLPHFAPKPFLTSAHMDDFFFFPRLPPPQQLPQIQNTNKDRVAAFIDSTQNLTTSLIPTNSQPDFHAADRVVSLPSGSLSDNYSIDLKQTATQNQGGHQEPRLRKFPKSASNSSDVERTSPSLNDDTLENDGKTSNSPRYDFRMNSHWKRLFVRTFRTAKRRLSGQGFAFWNWEISNRDVVKKKYLYC